MDHTKEKCYKLHRYHLGYKLYKGPTSSSQAFAIQVSIISSTPQTFSFLLEQCEQILLLIKLNQDQIL